MKLLVLGGLSQVFGSYPQFSPNSHQFTPLFEVFGQFWCNFHDFWTRLPYSDVTRPSVFVFNPFTRMLLGFSLRHVLPLSVTFLHGLYKNMSLGLKKVKKIDIPAKYSPKTIKTLKKISEVHQNTQKFTRSHLNSPKSHENSPFSTENQSKHQNKHQRQKTAQ